MSKDSATGNTRISIALCTYNGAKFLPAQLESYLEQTRLPDELVICDDGSHDETQSIIGSFAKNAPFAVHVHINETNLGSTKNFEKAIQLCTGDLIFLSDQDDVWMPEKLGRIEAEFLKRYEAGLIFSNARLADEELNLSEHRLWDFTFPETHRKKALTDGFLQILLSQDVITGATMAFRSGFRKEFMPIPGDIPEIIHDGWISLIISCVADIGFVDEPLMIYRQHPGQQLGLGPGMIEAKTHNEQRRRYARSIEFLQSQVIRLNGISNVWARFPKSEKALNVSHEEIIAEKKDMIAHYAARKDLPDQRRKRILPIINEILRGRYWRFSKGILSAAKDLLRR